MIVLRDVFKTYRSKKGTDCTALKGVSLSFPNKGLFFILGKSGSGKSTLLNVLGGLDKADSGTILYKGKTFDDFTERDFENYRNQEIGFIFQDYNLIEDFDVATNVEIALRLQGEKDKEGNAKLVENALKTVGLEGYGKRKVNELSGGQKQRIAIARAIVKNSSFILADEPTGNLDSETGEEVFNLLKEISKEKLVVVVSHDQENAHKFGEGIVEIADGKVVCDCEFQKQKEEEEKLEFSKQAKMPFSYSIRLALRNLTQKKFKTIITIISTVIMLMFTCGMHVFFDFNSERDIYYTAKDNNISQFTLETVGASQYGDFFIMGSIDNFKVYDYLEKNSAIKYASGHSIKNFNSLSIYYRDKTNPDDAGIHCEMKTNGYIIKTEQDVIDLGLELYENSQFNENGIYLSDVCYRAFRKTGVEIYKCKQGFTFNDIYDGSKIDITKIESYQGDESNFADLSGKILYKGGKILLINGIFKSGLIDSVSDGEFDYQLYFKARPDLKQKMIVKNIAGALFMTRSTYNLISGEISTNKGNRGFGYSVKVNDIEKKLTDGFCTYLGYGIRVFTEEGLGQSAPNLTDTEVLLSVYAYNELFPDNKLPEYSAEDMEQKGITVDQLGTPTHFGEELDLRHTKDTIDKNFYSGDKLILKGIYYPNDYRQNQFLYIRDAQKLPNDDDYKLVFNNENILINVVDQAKMKDVITELREDYSTGISGEIGSTLYMFESMAKQLASIFLVLLVVALATSVLLLINLISFGVSARTKEIGILKALGTSSSQLKKTFILETLVLAFIAFLLGFGVATWFVGFANTSIMVNSVGGTVGMTFFVLTPVSYSFMIVMTFIIMPLLAFIPLFRITRLNPVDAIKK